MDGDGMEDVKQLADSQWSKPASGNLASESTAMLPVASSSVCDMHGAPFEAAYPANRRTLQGRRSRPSASSCSDEKFEADTLFDALASSWQVCTV